MRVAGRYLRFVTGICMLVGVALCSRAQAPSSDAPAIEKQIDALLAKLTLEQKIDLIGGADGMSIRAIPEIGLPNLRMSDGPVGVRTWGPTTAYTAGIALAASWDPELAERVGKSLGEDARARGVRFLLGPGANIYRAPMNGRNFEYLGEDPYLAARTAVGYVKGVQSQGVVATIKHYAMNNQEYDRHNVSSDADERTMREIYLPVFEAAVREARVGAVMNSYNLVNGVHATQNPFLNLQVLKHDWGFDGILMSDWAATYDGVAAAKNGLDLEMPDAAFMNRKTLLPAIELGTLDPSLIDDKVRRILRIAIRFGFLSGHQDDAIHFSRYNPAGGEVALDEARESLVLLKNEGNLLPLDAGRVKTLAVIGPDAWPAVSGGGGSSNTTPYGAASLLEGLAAVPGLKVLYSPGLPSLQTIFDDTKFQPESAGRGSVKVETFPQRGWKGDPNVTYVDDISTWRPLVWSGDAGIQKSIRYSAHYLPKYDGSYLVAVAATASDGYRLTIDGREVMKQVSRESQAPQAAEIQLKAGSPVEVSLDYQPGAADPRISLGIRAVQELISPEAKAIAAAADAVVVCVGYDANGEAEGFDRSYTLPFGQDALIEEVSAVNPRTIVTLTSGGDVATHAWLNRVPAFFMNWYPGQGGGKAFAEVLFGSRSPEGKLPISFARSWEENPVHDYYYYSPSVPPDENPHVKYAEGVFLGYRYYTSRGRRPLFPFGFGLSYSTFAFSGLKIDAGDGSGHKVTVSFDVTNTGTREAAEVAEVYVGDPSAQVERPERELKAFLKVRLRPHQTQKVSFILGPRAFSYWDETTHDWKIDPGKFLVFAGDSSENTPLRQEFVLHP